MGIRIEQPARWPSAEEIRADALAMERVRLKQLGLPNSPSDAFVSQHLNQCSRELMNLAKPYGDGNHRRISWRRAWKIDQEALTATHEPTGFSMRFTPHPKGGYTAQPVEVPPFGPDSRMAMDQMFGLRELLKDGWEIFHTVVGGRSSGV